MMEFVSLHTVMPMREQRGEIKVFMEYFLSIYLIDYLNYKIKNHKRKAKSNISCHCFLFKIIRFLMENGCGKV